MLCDMCATIGRLRGSQAHQQLRRNTGEGVSLDCDACGRALGGTAGSPVATTLAQLARFGLLGQSPLLRRRA